MTRERKRRQYTPTVHHGDCLEVLRSLPDASVDAVVTDPPYALSFMGKAWDSHDTPIGFQAWCQLWAAECLRVLKPGGHLLAFGGTRTWHRLACAVEDAGFEVRDSIAWMYGSGFPKSLDVSKAIDRAAGVEREVVGTRPVAVDQWTAAGREAYARGDAFAEVDITAPATDAARTWQGWGTALKPAFEPIVVARKPLTGTVAGNVLAHGTGALNIDATRITTTDDLNGGAYRKDAQPCTDGTASTATRNSKAPTTAENASGTSTPSPDGPSSTPRTTGRHDGAESWRYVEGGAGEYVAPAGRWPANVILDEDQADALDQQSGVLAAGNRPAVRSADANRTAYGDFATGQHGLEQQRMDSGGASRFYYVAKAGKKERPVVDGTAHPTVKPLALMRWLVRLVTPPGGTVLEPFAGSGTTVEACILEGFNVIAIEREADYLPLIQSRIFRAQAAVAVEPEPDLFSEIDGEAS